MKAVLQHFGGKSRLADWIIRHFPPHLVYTETFGGGANVLLKKPRTKVEVYNDLNGDICNVFRVLRNPAQARELERLIRLTPYARSEYELTALVAEDPVEQARRTIVRSWFSKTGTFGQRWRAGFRLQRTLHDRIMPQEAWAAYPDRIEMFCRRLQGVLVENHPASWVLKRFDGVSTLHYVDPPYVSSTRGLLHRYQFDMTDDDHRELATTLHSLKGMVVLSGYVSDLYNDLYADWKRVEIKSLAVNNDRRTECLWLSPQALTRSVVQQPLLVED